MWNDGLRNLGGIETCILCQKKCDHGWRCFLIHTPVYTLPNALAFARVSDAGWIDRAFVCAAPRVIMLRIWRFCLFPPVSELRLFVGM